MQGDGTWDETRFEEAWRPQSLRASPPPWLSPPARAGVLGGIFVAHVLLALWLPWVRRGEAPTADEAMLVEFIDPVIEPEPEPGLLPEPLLPLPPAGRREPTPARASRPRRRPTPTDALQAQVVPATEPLRLYGEDGRLILPEDMLEQIDRRFGDTRQFDYQVPGMERAAKLFNRPPPIVYEGTRFDEYWKPDQDLLTALLTEMVEKTTKEIRVKVPGRSQSTMVCKVSLLALGGGCGVLTPGSDYVGPKDDPDTLSPEEAKQCDAWWEQIVGATTQDAWRRTRKLYEQQCRKPLERAPAG